MEEELHEISNDCVSAGKGLGMDPLEVEEAAKSNDSDDSDASDTRGNTSPSSRFINDVVVSVLDRMKNPYGLPDFSLDTIEQKETPFSRPKPQRYHKETKEAREFRLLRQRMLQMKNRLLICLELPEKAEEEKKRCTEKTRLKRIRRRETETPEQAAARKKRHAEQMRMSRKRLLAMETPEQTAARIAKRNERKKLRDQERFAKETPEERAVRRERERTYRDKLYQKHKVSHGLLAARTGKIRTVASDKPEENIVGAELTEANECVVKSEKEIEMN